MRQYTDRIQLNARALCYPDRAFPSRLTSGSNSATTPGRERPMRMRTLVTSFCLAAGLMAASPAAAQYGAHPVGPTPRPGERYHVEISGSFWNPTPDDRHFQRGAGDRRQRHRLRQGSRHREGHVQAVQARAAAGHEAQVPLRVPRRSPTRPRRPSRGPSSSTASATTSGCR